MIVSARVHSNTIARNCRMKSHYDVLGIPTNATQQQVVTAYRLRSKVLHPDRFDRTKQSVEWELANELLKELNASYAILRDPNNRAEYDRAIGVSQTSATARQTSSASGATQTAARTPPPRASVVPPSRLVTRYIARFQRHLRIDCVIGAEAK